MKDRYSYVLADVFTRSAFGGNQLAVFPEAEGLSTEGMQAIARELSLPETTFVLASEGDVAVKKVRFFTPFKELPLAGHPTIGTAIILARRGDLGPTYPLSAAFETGLGLIEVQVEARAGQPDFAWMAAPQAVFGLIRADRAQVASGLGLAATALLPEAPIQVVSTGVPFLLTPLRSLADVQNSRLDPAAADQLLADCEGLYVFTLETDNPAIQAHARMFSAGPQGIYEDPATGSAAGPLGAYLHRYQLIRAYPELRLICEQGLEMGRPSQIHIRGQARENELEQLRIGGEIVVMGEGAMQGTP